MGPRGEAPSFVAPMLISLLGIAVVLVAVLDVVLTVLDASGASLLSRRLYRGMWWVWRHGGRALPPRAQAAWLSFGAPLMVPGVVAVWFLLVIVGFAFIYFGGMSPDNFFFGGGSQPSLEAAFRLSWVTLSTIGFVEISPSSTSYSFTVAAQAILGGVILTMAITYFLRVHNVLLGFHVLATSLHHHAGDIAQPRSYLRTHFVDGEPRALEPWLHDLVRAVVEVHEGMRRHPIVYWYRPRRRWRSAPHLLRALSEVVAGLRWGLPSGHPVTAEPSLLALRAALEAMARDLDGRLVPVVRRSPARPIGYSDFTRLRAHPDRSPDPWVAGFLTLESWMRELAGGLATPDGHELYGRYREWLPFAAAMHDVTGAADRDLGYVRDLRPDDEDVLDVIGRVRSGPVQRPQPLLDVRG